MEFEHNGGPDHLATRLRGVCDTSAEAVYIAEAIRHAMESEDFRTRYGTYSTGVLEQYIANSTPNQD